jgi:hypothetical protein
LLPAAMLLLWLLLPASCNLWCCRCEAVSGCLLAMTVNDDTQVTDDMLLPLLLCGCLRAQCVLLYHTHSFTHPVCCTILQWHMAGWLT